MNAAAYYAVNPEPELDQPGYPSKVHVHAFDVESTSQHGVTPLPARTATRRPFRQAVTNIWLWELACWFFALACFVAIVAILYTYNGKPVPNWKYGITLATIVSLLSSVATFALVIPLEEGLGQLKWLWFRKARPISDFEIIEGAAGGPPGSAMLLARGKGGIMAWAGAILTILVLAVSPFIQQIITTDFQAVPKPGASLPIATTYLNTSAAADVDLPMRAAIQSGLLMTGNSSAIYNPPVHCPTGNCTFPIARSLSVCGSCADLTSQLKAEDANQDDQDGTIYSLPNGLSLFANSIVAGVSMTINNTFTNGSLESIAFTNHNGAPDAIPLADIFIIVAHYDWDGSMGTPTDLNMGPYAAECILQFCIQDYNSTSNNGTFTQNTTSTPITSYLGTSPDSNLGSFTTPDGTNHPYNYITADSNTTTALNYTIGYAAVNSLYLYLGNLFTSGVAQYNSPSASQSHWPDDVTQAVFTQLNATPHTLDTMFDNIARSMTLNMRTRPDVQTLQGQALYQEPIVAIRWVWISLPVAILVLALIFLLSVAVATRQAGLEVWKTGSIATLFALHGLQASDMMEQEAERLHVKLRDDGRGGRRLERVS